MALCEQDGEDNKTGATTSKLAELYSLVGHLQKQMAEVKAELLYMDSNCKCQQKRASSTNSSFPPRMASHYKCSAKSPSTQRTSAVVKWFSSSRGFGFVTLAEGGGDVFVHHSAIDKPNPNHKKRTLADGETVEFVIVSRRRGREALHVTGPGGTAVRGSSRVPHVTRPPAKGHRKRRGPSRKTAFKDETNSSPVTVGEVGGAPQLSHLAPAFTPAASGPDPTAREAMAIRKIAVTPVDGPTLSRRDPSAVGVAKRPAATRTFVADTTTLAPMSTALHHGPAAGGTDAPPAAPVRSVAGEGGDTSVLSPGTPAFVAAAINPDPATPPVVATVQQPPPSRFPVRSHSQRAATEGLSVRNSRDKVSAAPPCVNVRHQATSTDDRLAGGAAGGQVDKAVMTGDNYPLLPPGFSHRRGYDHVINEAILSAKRLSYTAKTYLACVNAPLNTPDHKRRIVALTPFTIVDMVEIPDVLNLPHQGSFYFLQYSGGDICLVGTSGLFDCYHVHFSWIGLRLR